MNADIFTQSVGLGNINPIDIGFFFFFQTWENIDPQNVLNDLKASISLAALT